MSMDFIEVDYKELCCSTYNQDSQDGKPFAEPFLRLQFKCSIAKFDIQQTKMTKNSDLLTWYFQKCFDITFGIIKTSANIPSNFS